ncbi:hypothetical protein [uncultured Aquimarina sp.]|uniref:hypothetical protein n=1 Tax=uncultured Aquimarina sp. TaxID=575652 RepID=UPI00260B1EC5|nr:hypothetical protein [uncultured Aquimarina sp.]
MMGGYGHNLSNLLKNSRRKERKAYDGWTESDSESKGIEAVSVSEELLQEIRDKLKRQRKQTRRKHILTIVLSVAVFILLFWFVLYQ